ncbi:MAG: EutN/CcmL family microcompartment protein [Eubacteriales bacterium]|nr:EutN/CcmL family microcompartment protein [Eubacteriales bacterium]
MYTGRVEGTVVASVKDENLRGVKLLLVRVIENGKDKNLIVAGDATRQAGEGDFVTLVGSKEAALLFRLPLCPCDAGITGFIDDYHEEL